MQPLPCSLLQMHSFYLQVAHQIKRETGPRSCSGEAALFSTAHWGLWWTKCMPMCQQVHSEHQTGPTLHFLLQTLVRWILTSALRVIALPALSPWSPAFGSAVGRSCALTASLLGAIGARHWALAPRAPLLPLSIHCHRRHKRDRHSRVTTKTTLGLVGLFYFMGKNTSFWADAKEIWAEPKEVDFL